MNKGFASIVFILLTFTFIIFQSFYLMIIKTNVVAQNTLQRIKTSTKIFKTHYNKLKQPNYNQANKIVTSWGERQIITPFIAQLNDHNKLLPSYNNTYIQ
jgi:hypothetical protein